MSNLSGIDDMTRQNANTDAAIASVTFASLQNMPHTIRNDDIHHLVEKEIASASSALSNATRVRQQSMTMENNEIANQCVSRVYFATLMRRILNGTIKINESALKPISSAPIRPTPISSFNMSHHDRMRNIFNENYVRMDNDSDIHDSIQPGSSSITRHASAVDVFHATSGDIFSSLSLSQQMPRELTRPTTKRQRVNAFDTESGSDGDMIPSMAAASSIRRSVSVIPKRTALPVRRIARSSSQTPIRKSLPSFHPDIDVPYSGTDSPE